MTAWPFRTRPLTPATTAPYGSRGQRLPAPSRHRAIVPCPGRLLHQGTASPPASGAHRDDVSGYPVQYAKVQPPPLREEDVGTPSALDWLALEDPPSCDPRPGRCWLRQDDTSPTSAPEPESRTLWYRLDEDDRDWISLLSHSSPPAERPMPGSRQIPRPCLPIRVSVVLPGTPSSTSSFGSSRPPHHREPCRSSTTSTSSTMRPTSN